MKLLLDLQGCQSTGSRQRGIGRYSLALAQAMVRQATGHECWLLLNGAFPDTVPSLAAAFEGLLPAGRIAVFRPPRDCAESAREGRWRTLAAERVRQHAIRALAPDVLHVSSLFEGYLDDCATSVDAQDVPIAVTLYDLIPLQHPQRYLADPRTRAWYERKLAALGRAPLLLGISEATCEEARAALPPGPRTIVNIASAGNPCFRPEGPRGTAAARLGLVRPFAMYTGGIDWRKNIEGLVQAWARLPPRVRASHQLALVCHAQDHARSAVLGAARAAGLAPDELVLTGWVSDEDLADLYRSCALFVFPSLHEGFGLPALEAMMCGAPVIGSNTSSIPEVIGRADALFDPRDPGDMAARMLRGLEDEAFRDALRAHAPVQSARFSWERCAHDALQALERLHAASPRKAARPVPARPRLALVTPLPPLESGIAEYSMVLAAALQPYYEIELVSDQAEVTLPPALAGLPVRSAEWFRTHGRGHDRVLYQFGNSVLHAPMFELLRAVPGVVVLHDFFLSGVQNWMEELGLQPGALASALFRSHGAAALDYLRTQGRDAAVLRYPANRFVLERATGVIVHSAHALAAADEWYGAGTARGWRRIGQMRALPATVPRAEARAALGLREDDFLACAFGHLGPTKLNLELLQAWSASTLAADPHCRLALVGRNTRPPYGDQVDAAVAALGPRVTVTGFTDDARYGQYLAAADLAVQLRTGSRGETSRAVLDALAYGVPLLVNAHGTNTEYPDDVAFSIRDGFDVAELARALESLRQDRAQRSRLGAAGPAWIAGHHDPQRIAAQVRDAIEHFAARPQRQAYWSLMEAIGALGAPDAPDDLVEAAVAIAAMDWNRD